MKLGVVVAPLVPAHERLKPNSPHELQSVFQASLDNKERPYFNKLKKKKKAKRYIKYLSILTEVETEAKWLTPCQ